MDEAESNEPEQSRKVASALKATDSSTERDGILKRDVLGGGSSGSRSMERIDSIKPSALVTRPTSLVHATSSSFSSSSSSSVIMGSAPSVASSGSRRATSAGSSSLLAVGGTRPSSTSANVSFSDDPDSKRAKMNK